MHQFGSPRFPVDLADLVDNDPGSLLITFFALPLVLIDRLAEQLITGTAVPADVANTVTRTAADTLTDEAVAPDMNPQECGRQVRVQDFG